MKYTLLCLSFLCLNTSIIIGQPPDIMDLINSNETDRIIDDDCISLHLDLGKRLIVLDCPEYDYYEYDTDQTFSIDFEAACLERNCHLNVYIFFNGVLLAEQRLSGDDQLFHYPVDYLHLQNLLEENYSSDEAILEIKYVKSCYIESGDEKPIYITYDPVVEKIPIQIKYEYQTYTVDLVTKRAAFDLCEELYANNQVEIDEVSSCCGKEINVDSRISISEGNNLSIDGRITLGLNSGFSGLDGGINFSYSESKFKISQSVISYGEHFSFSSAEGSCIFLGYKIFYRKHEVLEKLVSCIGGESTVNKLDEYYEIYKVQPTQCDYKINCNGQNPYIDIEIQSDDFAFGFDCRADVILTLINPEQAMPYEFSWIGPDGQNYDSKDLADVPFGLYELTIKDGCCNEYSFQVNVCVDIFYGPWYFENGKYCRAVMCHCDDIATLRQADQNYTMCVLPERYDEIWTYDNHLKKCTRHAYYTDQNGFEWDLTAEVGETDIQSGDPNLIKDPFTIEYYDNFYNQCIREYFCSEEVTTGMQESEEPVFGDWIYNEFDDACYREVFCFGKEVLDQNGFPTQDETYNTSFDWSIEMSSHLQCLGLVRCDDELTDQIIYVEPDLMWALDEISGDCVTHYIACNREIMDDLSEEPAYVFDWEWDGGELCFREVYCQTAQEYLTEYTGALFVYDPSNSANCDNDLGEYSYQVNCDDDLIGWFCIQEEPPTIQSMSNADQGFTAFSPEQLSSVELADPNFPDNTQEISMTSCSVYINSGEGYLTEYFQGRTYGEALNFIQEFKLKRASKNSLYFITVFADGRHLYSNKFIDFH